jgi:hypothetical protein
MAKQDSQPDPMSIQIGGGVAVASTVAGSNFAPHLAYHDLRKWIEEAHKLGEIKEVNGLSWQHDIGMVSEMALHDDNAPCFIFGDVPGTIEGSRVLVARDCHQPALSRPRPAGRPYRLHVPRRSLLRALHDRGRRRY